MYGLDPNVKVKGYNAFHAASEGGRVEILKLLLRYGSEEPSNGNNWRLQHAIRRRHTEMAKFYMERMTDNDLRCELVWNGANAHVFESIVRGNIEVTRILVNRNVVFYERQLINALHLQDNREVVPSYNRPRHVEIIEFLLERGFRPSIALVEMALCIPDRASVGRLLKERARLQGFPAKEIRLRAADALKQEISFKDDIDIPAAMDILDAGIDLREESRGKISS